MRHLKTIEYDLMGCNNIDCPVVTFIKSENCPGCRQKGSLLRHAIQPPSPGAAPNVRSTDSQADAPETPADQ